MRHFLLHLVKTRVIKRFTFESRGAFGRRHVQLFVSSLWDGNTNLILFGHAKMNTEKHAKMLEDIKNAVRFRPEKRKNGSATKTIMEKKRGGGTRKALAVVEPTDSQYGTLLQLAAFEKWLPHIPKKDSEMHAVGVRFRAGDVGADGKPQLVGTICDPAKPIMHPLTVSYLPECIVSVMSMFIFDVEAP